ncbi:MAG TPA: flagellar assembly protein FliW [Candidatus Latescibacteria bacterium]|nr:flagellar assembly protein FliW [Gemmatimonadota bacterium]HCR16779.1 flagellar assembly protein FliW [Candidatus Latescibacterota bacterium]
MIRMSPLLCRKRHMKDEVIRFKHVRFEEQEVSRERVIEFPDGVPGFEQFKSFAVFSNPESEPFQWLLSIENEQLGFVVINPLMIWAEYDPRISREDLKSLEVDDPEDVVIYTIVTLTDDPMGVTANLSGPILLNSANMKARQLALLDDRYTTKHKILDTLQV